MKVNFIGIDCEATGIGLNSILQLSMEKCEFDTVSGKITPLETFNRYYLSEDGQYNQMATKVHGLTVEFLEKMVKIQCTPRIAREDVNSILEFIGDVKHFVAHGMASSERPMLRKIGITMPYVLCTSRANANALNLKNKNGSTKKPKLIECVEFYKVPVHENKLHDSLYDTQIMINVMYKMFKHDKFTKDILINFFENNVSVV